MASSSFAVAVGVPEVPEAPGKPRTQLAKKTKIDVASAHLKHGDGNPRHTMRSASADLCAPDHERHEPRVCSDPPPCAGILAGACCDAAPRRQGGE